MFLGMLQKRQGYCQAAYGHTYLLITSMELRIRPTSLVLYILCRMMSLINYLL